MKKLTYTLAFALFSMVSFVACNGGQDSGGGHEEIENTDLVESGTYTGTAHEVVPDEKEIYVKTDDNKTLELYFTDQTTLTRNGESADFNELEKGQKVRVEVEKKGKRLEPISVEIME